MEEKDRIISTERGLPKQPSFLTHITLLARLWALATLAGKVYDSSLILASFDYFVFKAHIFLLIEQKKRTLSRRCGVLSFQRIPFARYQSVFWSINWDFLFRTYFCLFLTRLVNVFLSKGHIGIKHVKEGIELSENKFVGQTGLLFFFFFLY